MLSWILHVIFALCCNIKMSDSHFPRWSKEATIFTNQEELCQHSEMSGTNYYYLYLFIFIFMIRYSENNAAFYKCKNLLIVLTINNIYLAK